MIVLVMSDQIQPRAGGGGIPDRKVMPNRSHLTLLFLQFVENAILYIWQSFHGSPMEPAEQHELDSAQEPSSPSIRTDFIGYDKIEESSSKWTLADSGTSEEPAFAGFC